MGRGRGINLGTAGNGSGPAWWRGLLYPRVTDSDGERRIELHRTAEPRLGRRDSLNEGTLEGYSGVAYAINGPLRGGFCVSLDGHAFHRHQAREVNPLRAPPLSPFLLPRSFLQAVGCIRTSHS
ncbi:hypothetical protein MRX96_043234 [Rhipicephalus microplus]